MHDNFVPSEPAPIAVLVDREGLGDALLKLPFLRALVRAYPGRPVWWIATHQTAMAHELAPFVGDLVARVIEHARLTEPAREVIPNLRKLPPFDLVFDSRTRIPTVLLARVFLKHRGFYACLPGFMLSSRRPPGRWTRPRGIAERMLTTVEAATRRPADWQGAFEPSPQARTVAAARLPHGRTYVGLAVGSREARKNWPLVRFAALARRLSDAGLTPVFFIGPQEREWVAELRRAAPFAEFPQAFDDDVDAILPPLDLAIAIAGRLSAAVANDSGIGHLLGASGTPLVSLFGPTDPARWAPFTARGIVVRAQDFGGTAMEAIPVDAVFGAVETLIAR